MHGQIIGQYRIREQVGSGAMSTVYRADDLSAHRTVAVKVMADRYLHDGQALARFEREGRACMSLNHPNICSTFDIGKWHGRPFLVMELLTGTTMACRMKTGPMRPQGAAVVGLPVLAALQAAHEKGILHRDIKPANLFLTAGGQVKILDFGLAKAPAGWASAGAGGDNTATVVTFVTTPGTLLGTLGYMAPEQVRGEPLDGRADLYSLGIVMFEALTGSLPIRGGGQPPLPDPLGPFLARLIEPRREARFASAAEARDALIALKLKQLW